MSGGDSARAGRRGLAQEDAQASEGSARAQLGLWGRNGVRLPGAWTPSAPAMVMGCSSGGWAWVPSTPVMVMGCSRGTGWQDKKPKAERKRVHSGPGDRGADSEAWLGRRAVQG